MLSNLKTSVVESCLGIVLPSHMHLSDWHVYPFGQGEHELHLSFNVIDAASHIFPKLTSEHLPGSVWSVHLPHGFGSTFVSAQEFFHSRVFTPLIQLLQSPHWVVHSVTHLLLTHE